MTQKNILALMNLTYARESDRLAWQEAQQNGVAALERAKERAKTIPIFGPDLVARTEPLFEKISAEFSQAASHEAALAIADQLKGHVIKNYKKDAYTYRQKELAAFYVQAYLDGAGLEKNINFTPKVEGLEGNRQR